jgi:hypothetical protein
VLFHFPAIGASMTMLLLQLIQRRSMMAVFVYKRWSCVMLCQH